MSKVAQPRQAGAYLLGGRVFNGVRVVIVIDDIQILHGVARDWAAELHVERGLSGSLGVDSEVGGFPVFHTWEETVK